MAKRQKPIDPTRLDDLIQRLDEGVLWRDGRNCEHHFQGFDDEVRDRVACFLRTRNGKPFDEAELFAYLKYMRIADSSAAHIPIEALRRCDPIFDDFAARVASLTSGQEGDEVATRTNSAWTEAVNAMIAERVPRDTAAQNASSRVCGILIDAFRHDEGFRLYLEASKRFPIEHLDETGRSRFEKFEFRNRRRVEAYIEAVYNRYGRIVTKKEIYAAVRCSRRTFESWERGEARVGAEMAAKIAKFLANLDYFKK